MHLIQIGTAFVQWSFSLFHNGGNFDLKKFITVMSVYAQARVWTVKFQKGITD